MLATKKRFILKRDDRCPCGETSLPLKDCCLSYDGQLRKKRQKVLPPIPKTSFSQNGCYLASTCDCSRGLSAEHYMSKNILEVIGDGKAVSIDGFPWQKTSEMQVVGINSLTAKILCSRHNSSLATLDASAGKFFRKLQEIFINLRKKSLSRKRSFVIMSGEDIELWMLKVACGLFFSNNASRDGKLLLIDHNVNGMLITNAFYHGKWAERCGLYIKETSGHVFLAENTVATAPVSVPETKAFIGVELKISGLSFRLLFDPNGWEQKLLEEDGWGFRPSELLFRNRLRTHSIALTWENNTPQKSIQIDLLPKGWQPDR